MSGELIPGCYESKLLRLEDKLQKAQTELQEARRLLGEWYSWEHSKTLQARTRAFLGVDDAD